MTKLFIYDFLFDLRQACNEVNFGLRVIDNIIESIVLRHFGGATKIVQLIDVVQQKTSGAMETAEELLSSFQNTYYPINTVSETAESIELTRSAVVRSTWGNRVEVSSTSFADPIHIRYEKLKAEINEIESALQSMLQTNGVSIEVHALISEAIESLNRSTEFFGNFGKRIEDLLLRDEHIVLVWGSKIFRPPGDS